MRHGFGKLAIAPGHLEMGAARRSISRSLSGRTFLGCTPDEIGTVVIHHRPLPICGESRSKPLAGVTNLPGLIVRLGPTNLAVEPLEAGDQARPLPYFAVTVSEPFPRRLDRLLVVSGVDPFAGRNPAHAIEAVKPV